MTFGIRTALGASPRQDLRAIVARPVRQVTVGLAIGTAAALLFYFAARSGDAIGGGFGASAVLLVAAGIAVVDFLAALGPARRELRIEPGETLKAET